MNSFLMEMKLFFQIYIIIHNENKRLLENKRNSDINFLQIILGIMGKNLINDELITSTDKLSSHKYIVTPNFFEIH